jgi:leader peptidase (prepilin peptidase)/N-methyltransferase
MESFRTLYLGIATPASFVPPAMAALLGLVFGSFLNVCITRLPLHESIQHPRSHCRNCARTLPWFENIPLLSWLLLRGRCRGCKLTISWRYPLVEVSLAALWLECYRRFGATPAGFCAALLCFLLLGLAFTDLELFLLPDAMTLTGLLAGIMAAFLRGTLRTPMQAIEGACLGAAILLLISGAYYLLRRKQGMGMGDVKLLAMIGAFLGPAPVLLVFFLGTIATAVAAIAWLVVRRFPGRWNQQPMPYGTFLSLAGIFSLFWGPRLLAWYLGIFR